MEVQNEKEKNSLEKLRTDLNGKFPAVAKIFGCSASYVSLVLNEKRRSPELIATCIKFAKELKEEMEKLQLELQNYNEE